MPQMSTHATKDHYTAEFLESLYSKICLAHAFVSGAEKQMNICDAPIDDLYEHVELVFTEIDDLFDRMCKLTNRVRVTSPDDDKRSSNAAYKIDPARP